jgi:hypothetical protein
MTRGEGKVWLLVRSSNKLENQGDRDLRDRLKCLDYEAAARLGLIFCAGKGKTCSYGLHFCARPFFYSCEANGVYEVTKSWQSVRFTTDGRHIEVVQK